MSSNGGGGSNLLDMGLMIAAGVAAPELAATMAPEIMAAGGAGAVATGAAVGAGTSALTAAATGQNVGRAALFGGIGGGISGGMGPNGFTGEPPTSGGPLPGPNLDEEGNLLPNLPSTGAPPVAPPGTPPVPPPAPTPNFLGDPNVTNKALYTAAGINALGYMNNTRPAGAYTPPNAIYTGGPLQKFKYDPNNYQPDVVKPPSPLYQAQYAEGGITKLSIGGDYSASASNPNGPLTQPSGGIGSIVAQAVNQRDATMQGPNRTMNLVYDPKTGNYVIPQSMAAGGKSNSSNMDMIEKYMSDYQSAPASVKSAAQNGDYNAMIALNKINNTPNQNYASGGGISDLGSYSDGGRLLKGPGDGMSDDIPAKIGHKQEARLADGEFVVPADVVSHLGNGSTDAGARHLYKMMDKVRHARTGRKSQAKQIKADKYVPA